MSSCCGEPATEESKQATPYNRQPIDQQPSPHPGAQFHDKRPSFQQPALTSPTPTHPYSQNSYTGQNGYQQPLPSNWSHHSPSPPPVNQFGAYGSSTITGSSNSYSQTQHQPLLQPTPVHNAALRGDTSSPHISP